MFDLQDHVTESVVGAIAPKLQSEEIKRANRKPTENLVAYDYYLRGLASASFVDQGSEQPRRSGSFAKRSKSTLVGLCIWHGGMVLRSAQSARLDDRPCAGKRGRLCGSPGKQCIWVAMTRLRLCMGGYALAFVAHEFDDAAAFMDRGMAVNPEPCDGLDTWRVVEDLER